MLLHIDLVNYTTHEKKNAFSVRISGFTQETKPNFMPHLFLPYTCSVVITYGHYCFPHKKMNFVQSQMRYLSLNY